MKNVIKAIRKRLLRMSFIKEEKAPMPETSSPGLPNVLEEFAAMDNDFPSISKKRLSQRTLSQGYPSELSRLFDGETEEPAPKKPSDFKFKSPKEMAEEVKKYVIGQDEAIERLSVPFFQHALSKFTGRTCTVKTAALLVGPTGVGKDETCRRFAQLCECPIIRINASEVTPTGWAGMNFSDMLALRAAAYNDEDLRYAIIIFDEFDKIPHYSANKDDDGIKQSAILDMQLDLMRLFETGTSLVLEGEFSTRRLPVDNLLILFTGAFAGMEKVIKQRLEKEAREDNMAVEIEFEKDDNVFSELAVKDLEEWGFLPELLGRIGQVCALKPLNADDIYRVMTLARDNAFDAHVANCKELYNRDLTFTDDALRYIAHLAGESALGCRTIKTLLADIMGHIYFNLTCSESLEKERKIEIGKEYIMALKSKQKRPFSTKKVRTLGFQQRG